MIEIESKIPTGLGKTTKQQVTAIENKILMLVI